MAPNQGQMSVVTKVETVLTVIVGVLAAVTMFWHDWIEVLTGWDPDHHSGTFEFYIIIGLAVIALVLGLLARVSWRRDRARRIVPA
jgi:undecaprenyl pyrophosphate phosphatase UppP